MTDTLATQESEPMIRLAVLTRCLLLHMFGADDWEGSGAPSDRDVVAAMERAMPGLDRSICSQLAEQPRPVSPELVVDCLESAERTLSVPDEERPRYAARMLEEIRRDVRGQARRFPQASGSAEDVMMLEDLMLELAELRPRESVLDLSFGSSRVLARGVAGGSPVGPMTVVSADKVGVLAALLDLRLAGLRDFAQIRVVLADPVESRATVSMLAGRFDRVLVDPRWGRRLHGEDRRELPFSTQFAESALLQVALGALRPNGRVVMLTSDGLLFRDADAELRREILTRFSPECVVSVPPSMFVSGAKASLLVVHHAVTRGRVRFARLPAWATPGHAERAAAGQFVRAIRGDGAVEECWQDVEREVLARLGHSLLPEQILGVEGQCPSIVLALPRFGVPLVPLPDVARFMSGVNPKPDWKMKPGSAPEPNSVGLLRITELRGDRLHEPVVVLTARASARVDDERRLRRGDLLVSMKATIGKVFAVTEDRGDVAPGDSLVLIRPDPNALLGDYAAALLRGPLYHRWLQAQAYGMTGQTRVRVPVFKKMLLPVPSLGQQRALFDEAQRRGMDIVDVLLDAVAGATSPSNGEPQGESAR